MTRTPFGRRIAAAALATALAALGAGLAAPSAALADDEANWTVRTASTASGTERTNYAYAVNAGTSTSDAIVVANHGAAALDLAVYAADGYTNGSGQFDVRTAKQKSIGIGAWAHADSDRVTVPAGATATVPFTLTVPKNASPGDYAGAIVTSLTSPDAAAGINVDRRLGIRMTLRVGGDLVPRLAIEGAAVSWSGGLNPFATGSATVSYTLHNTGNAILSAKQAIGTTGPFGWFAASAGTVAAPPQLLPGERWTVRVKVPAVAASLWLAATVHVTPVVTDASGSTTVREPVSATATGWAPPWLLLAVLVLAAAAAVAVPRIRRRLRAAATAREDARVEEAVERALAGVVAAHEE